MPRQAAAKLEVINIKTEHFRTPQKLITITITRDPNGNPTTITEQITADSSLSLETTYDLQNRPSTHTTALGLQIAYTYRPNGQIETITYPDNRTVTYSYDNADRLITVTDWTNRETTFTYDPLNRIKTITRPNNTQRTHIYDNVNRPTKLTEKNLTENSHIYYGNYTYDNDGRLIKNIRVPLTQPHTPSTTNASYDADNRIAYWETLVNGEPTLYGNLYSDNNGNIHDIPVSPNIAIHATYDVRNRLVAVDNYSHQYIHFHYYDPLNNRIATQNYWGYTYYLIDPHGASLPRILEIQHTDNSATTYIYAGQTLLYQINPDSTATYYHYDQSANTIALTDNDGTITDTFQYTPYGELTHDTGTTWTPFQFCGQLGVYTDEDSGLIHMRARYYSPHLKRFISADPIQFQGGMNWFAYANGNPIRFVDPTGTTWIDAALVAGGAAWGVISRRASDAITGHETTWQEYTGSAIGGAVTAEALFRTRKAVVAGALGGAAANASTQVFNIASGTQNEFDVNSFLWDTGTSAAMGLLPGAPKIAGINAGRGSFLQVSKQLSTKLERGTIHNVSLPASMKATAGLLYHNLTAGFAIQMTWDIGSQFFNDTGGLNDIFSAANNSLQLNTTPRK